MGATRPRPARKFRAPVTRIVSLALILCAIPLAGCGKKNRVTQPIVTPSIYPALSTPENVMAALVQAYSFRDSVEYGLLFDETYLGASTDYQSPSPQTLIFTKADELAHIGALARSRTILGVALDFGSQLSRAGSDSAGWASIQLGYVFLEIRDGFNSYFLSPQNSYMAFEFKPTTPDASSATDTTWKIVRWTEIQSP